MPEADITSESPANDSQAWTQTKKAMIVLVCAIIAVNVVMILAAAKEGGFGGLGIGAIYAPVTNGLIALIAMAGIRTAKRSGWPQLAAFLLVAIGVPLVATVLSMMTIGTLIGPGEY